MSRDSIKYDFRPIGQAIKKARISQGWTREQSAQEDDLSPRYIISLKNNAQHPSFQVFITLMTLFNISADQFLFPESDNKKSTHRRQLDTMLDGLDERDYIVMEATAAGLKKAKGAEE